MHVYKIVHGGDSNKYDNLNFTKLFYAWLEIFKRYLHGNENLIIRRNMYLIFWDGNINVILIAASRYSIQFCGAVLQPECGRVPQRI